MSSNVLDISYYIITEESITLVFTDYFFNNGLNTPSQLYIYQDDWRFDILKKNLLSQGETKVFNTDIFKIEPISSIKELIIDDYGNVSYEKGAIRSNTVSNSILKKLINFYGTPVYDCFLRLVRSQNAFIKMQDARKHYVMIYQDYTTAGTDWDNSIVSGIREFHYDSSFASKQLDATPYVNIFKNQGLELSFNCDSCFMTKNLISSLENFKNFLETFWKCSYDQFDKLSDNLLNNNLIIDKFFKDLNKRYDVVPETIPFIRNKFNDMDKMCSLYLTGMISEKH